MTVSSERLRLLRGLPGCAGLAAEELAGLDAAAVRTEEYKAGCRLVTEGQNTPDLYWIVEAGALEISRLDAESDGLLDYLTAGDVFDPGVPGAPAAPHVCSPMTRYISRPGSR